ncbi:CDP-alcohol phosphatidyltransferase family protein [Roseobacter sp.]|uniref:CDP-alcohol phosphatidyltransferase family protein n=1 Tax=Roseobacter sp. TaxID=1907202 RepID=UPI003298D22C
MFDSRLRQFMDPTLNALGRRLARAGCTANGMTLAGLLIGLSAAVLIALGLTWMALAPLVLSRLADGLDGAVARATQQTDFGGYFDISADFLFYGSVPFAFVLLDPAQNGVAGAFLLAAFYFNGTSFLGYAIMAEKRGMSTTAQGLKSLYYSNGLLEGAETIVFFVVLCAWPAAFAPFAWAFGIACFATGLLRIYSAQQIFLHVDNPDDAPTP